MCVFSTTSVNLLFNTGAEIYDPSWAQECLMKFISFQLKRANRGEISEATVPNYYKAVKLFCEMNDLTLSWKKISKELLNRKMSANDRTPTIDEIIKLAKYPDRAIQCNAM